MPSVLRANTNLTPIMIGERIGAWLREAAPPHRTSSVVRPARCGRRTLSLVDRCLRFQEVRDLGADFLESRQRPDGMIGDVETAGLGGFYKAVWALAAAGRAAAAARLAGWIRRHGFTPAGDFVGEFPRGPLDQLYPYPNAWLTAGLQRIAVYDLAGPAMRFLARLQDAESGGIATLRAGPGPGVRQEVLSRR
jgi:hypothetical protein